MIERLAVILALLQDCVPAKPGLRTLGVSGIRIIRDRHAAARPTLRCVANHEIGRCPVAEHSELRLISSDPSHAAESAHNRNKRVLGLILLDATHNEYNLMFDLSYRDISLQVSARKAACRGRQY